MNRSLWFWHSVWGFGLLLGLGIFVLYAWLPVDGATGDLESFTPQGFQVQWLLEEREGGLQVGDVILRAGGHTVDEWLSGASRGPEWRTGGIVPYQILRDGQVMTLPIQLTPISFRAILMRWALQLIIILAYLCVGTLVLWKRPHEMAARILMLICVTAVLQQWGDAYNFQYATLPWRWPFWFHLALEQLTYSLIFASILHFILVFPITYPLLSRFPRLLPLALYTSFPLIISAVTSLYPSWSKALRMSNRAVLAASIVQIVLSFYIVLRSARVARDPMTRTQVRWLIWSIGLVLAVGGPGYILPLALTGHPLIPHPVATPILIIPPLALAVAILRYNLFDIEIIINRTLVYSTLTVSLAMIYFGSVALIQEGFRTLTGQESDVAIVLSTLAIAALFHPWRRYLQAFIDRRFYREKVDFRQALVNFSHEVRTIIELPELLHALIQRVTGLLHIAHGAVLLRSLEGTFELVEMHNLPRFKADQLPLTEAMLNRLQSGSAISRPQDNAFPLLVPLIAPQVSQGEVTQPLLIGVLALGPRLSGQWYTLKDQTLLIGLADQAGTAIYVAQLNKERQAEIEKRKEAEARRHLAETLRTLTVTLSSTLDLTKILERLLEGLAQIIPYTSSAVTLIQDDHLQVVASRGFADPETIHRLHIPVTSDELFAEIVHTRRPVLIADAQRDPRFKGYAGTEYVRGWIGIPLVYKGEIIGVLTIDSQTPEAFGEQETEIAFTFANQAAIAIENARLYEKAQQEIAERVRAEKGQREALAEALQATQALRESEQVLRDFLDSANDLVQIVASDGQFVYVNRKWCEVLGYTLDEVVDLSLADTIHPDSMAHCWDAFQRILAGETIDSLDAVFVSKDGENVYVEGSASCRFEDGQPINTRGIFHDITERKQAEAEREALITELEAKNTELERFTYTVSHDLKSPLITIQGFLGFLEQSTVAGDVEQVKADVARIFDATEKMQQLLDELLELSRIGRLINPPEDVPFGELAREAVEMVRGRLAERGAEVEIAPDLLRTADGPTVYGDRSRLYQVLQNLIDNAVKFMGDQPNPRVEIGTRRDGAETVFYVRDNGMGIDPRYHDKVFGLFEKLDPKAEGTGIGLATVKRILEVHGGRLWVESEGAGQGSTFCFALPDRREATNEET